VNIPKISALFESSLASALSAIGTSFTLVSGTDRDGNALSGRYGFIINESTSDEEFVIGTVSGTTVTIEYRGLDADAPNTEVSGNKKAHRRGASVKITDYPIIGVLRNIVNGDETLPNPLKYATGVVPVTADDLVDKAYADALVGGGTLSYDRIVIGGNGGEVITAGQVVYLNTADGEWYKADADTASNVENVNLGIAQGAGTDGGSIAGGVLIYGLDTNQTGLTNNTKYYASNTAGGLSNSAGTKEVTLGVSRSTTSIYFAPRFDQQLTEDLQDALVGTSGTPSSTNKFVTNDDTSATAGASKVVRSGSDSFIASGYIGTNKKLYISTTEVTFTDGNGGAGAGVEQTLFSTTIPGGTLGTNNAIRFKIFIRDANIFTSASTWSFKVKYGGATQLTLNNVVSANSLADMSGFLEGYIIADGATNVQKMTAEALLLDTAANTAEADNDAAVGMDKSHFYANASGAIDSTTDQTLAITLTQGNNAANDAVVEWCVIESIR